MIYQATATATVPDLRYEIKAIAILVRLAGAVRALGTGKKWDEPSTTPTR